MTCRTPIVLASALLVLAACQERERQQPRQRFDEATVRLGSATLGSPQVDAASLGDRDTTSGTALSGPVTVTAALDHDVEVRALKLHVRGEVQVSGDGFPTTVASGEGAWTRVDLAEPVRGRSFTVRLDPVAGAATVAEIELWGGGLARAPRDLSVLAPMLANPGLRFENVVVARGSVPGATLLPVGAQQGDGCVRTRFTGYSPRGARRAYLAYEANVQRSVVLSRSLNAAAPIGGFWIGSGAESRTITDELDPERLTGADDVQLCIPSEASAGVNVAGLRLVLLLDDGTDHWDRETRRRLAAGADGDAGTAILLEAGRHEVALDRFVAVEGDEATIVEPTAPQGQVGVLQAAGWSELGSVTWGAPAGLGISGRTIRAVHVDLGGAAGGPGAKLAELRLAGSGVGRRVDTPRIVLTYPVTRWDGGKEVAEHFGGKAFVQGWTESPGGPAVVEIGGARVGDGGVFATEVTRPIEASGAWSVLIRARFADGTEVTRTLDFADDHEDETRPAAADSTASIDERFGRENETGWGSIDAETGGKVRLGTDVELEAPAGAVSGKTAIGITRKGSEVMPPLDAGMVNVTAPAHFAYRFLPKGMRFAKAVKVKIPYDPALLPEGTAPEEIQTWYYDDAAKRWQPLPRVEVSRAAQRVTSETTHFTFMINAVLVLPEHPGPTSFNPNSIKDLKAADPSANVDLIEPPQANNQGTAQVSLPIRLPKARGAYQPSLRLSYDSGGGNGWLGVGWSLPVSSVAIDTKFGVPYYDGLERYVLDGAQLVPGALAPGGCVDQTDGRYYHARVEREYKRIVRCGTGVSDFRFEVTDRAGVLFLYGTDGASRLARSPYSAGPGVISEWYLARVIDLNGNLTSYTYDYDSWRTPGVPESGRPTPVTHAEPFTQAYLRSITYSGRAPRIGSGALADVLETGPYRVELQCQRSGGAFLLRPDVITSGRSGFKVVTRRRLASITVKLVGGAAVSGIRRYDLTYESGSGGKSRLKKVDVLGAWESGEQGPLFHTHELEYFDVADATGEAPSASSPIPLSDGAFGPPKPLTFPNDVDEHPMSRSQSWGFGVHGYIGIGPPAPSSVSVGVRGGYSRNQSTNMSALMDVNGDGLPDRLRTDRAGVQVRFNDGDKLFTPVAPPGDPHEGDPIPLLPIPTLGHSSSDNFNVALQAKASVFSLSYGWSWFSSSTPDFTIDADGDGLVDVLDRGKVLFNQPRNGPTVPDCTTNANNPSTFCFQPTKWVRQISSTPAPDLTADLTDDPEIAEAVAQIEAQLRPADALIEWLAPYEGNVEISGVLSFAKAAATIDPSWDGVRLTIYRATANDGTDPFFAGKKYMAERVAEPIAIKLGELNVPTPVWIPWVPVHSGDRLYFVLSTLSSFPVAKPGPVPLEEVEFAPSISYMGKTLEQYALRDPANAPAYQFDALADFRLAGAPLGALTVPVDGTVEVRSLLKKLPSADDVRLCVQKFAVDQEVTDLPCRAEGSSVPKLWGTELDSAFGMTQPVAVDFSASVQAGEKLVFRVESDLSIDPAAVDWAIGGGMTSICDDDGSNCRAPQPDEVDDYSFVADAYQPLHLHINTGADDSSLRTARPRPAPMEPFVAPEPGFIKIVNEGEGVGVPNVTFAIRRHDGLIYKGGVPGKGTQFASLPVDAGDQIFFEAHSERPADLLVEVADTCADGSEGCTKWVPTWTPQVSYVTGAGASIQIQPLMDQPVVAQTVDFLGGPGHAAVEGLGITSPFGGGFHGWRYGLWGGDNDKPIEPDLLEASEASTFDGATTEEEQVDKGLDAMDGGDGSGRKRAEYVQPLLPRRSGTFFGKGRPGMKPRVPGYVSRDGNVFVTQGTMHAARDGGYVEGGEEAGSGDAVLSRFKMGKMSRASVGKTVTGGLSVLFAGLSVGGGESRTKADVRDMNGDGIVDVIRSRSSGEMDVKLTDSTTMGQRSAFDLPPNAHIQENADVTVSVNLGVSDPVKSFVDDTSVVGAVVGMFPGFGGGVGVNFSATQGELVDVNGDGLPDVVRRVPTEPGFRVRLNLGTSFAAGEDFVPSNAWANPNLDDLIGKVTTQIAGKGGKRALAALGILRGGALDAVGDPNMVRRTTAVSINDNLGKGIGERYQASVNWESSVAATSVSMMDVNGDGLPDFVRKGPKDTQMRVMLNTGYGFLPERAWSMVAWPAHVAKPWLKSKAWIPATKKVLEWVVGSEPSVDSLEANGSYSDKPTIGFVYSYSFPLVFVRIHFSIGGDYTRKKLAGLDLALQDVDGDGLPDHVLKAEKLKGRDNTAVYYRPNLLRKGNLLKKVKRPLGGEFELDYDRTPPSVDMAGGRWVMKKVVLRDGREGVEKSGHEIETNWAYGEGYHDRAEREFLGFGRVVRTNADKTKVVQHYLNASFAVKGLLDSEETWDENGKLFVLTKNTYGTPVRLLAQPQSVCTARVPFFLSSGDYCQSFDVELQSTVRRHFEGVGAAWQVPDASLAVSTQQDFVYDDYGNVKEFHDFGDVADPYDDVWASVTYVDGGPIFERHAVSLPLSIAVRDAATGNLLRKRVATYDEYGNVATLTSHLSEGAGVTSTLAWTQYGTLESFEGPDVGGRHYSIGYEYDPVTHALPVKITDAHGYSSSATYDLRFGEVATTTDVNGKITRRTYDVQGRLQKLEGPPTGTAKLVEITYEGLVDTEGHPSTQHAGTAWAKTSNFPTGGALHSIDTVVIVDGLKRVLQTKKTAEVSTDGDEGVTLGWSATGQQAFDVMGRVSQQGLTYFEEASVAKFQPTALLHPTVTTYDPLGRPRTVTSPAEKEFKTQASRTAQTVTTYGIGAPGAGVKRLRTQVTDANGHVRSAYKSLADRVVAVEEVEGSQVHLTQYAYDRIGQLTKITDAANNETNMVYDLLGRRTVIDNPDAGRTDFQ
ncbi:MAG TPA: SpvB/TcaC N-terminal domain-containing protein, partial [Propionibacteriaceae bacterium]|nr:SpvB/TcaC N-terminal domain-containing protein [Propionibacteriaceae bacterium]